jgi:PTS system nitrogen regulatory IIA component
MKMFKGSKPSSAAEANEAVCASIDQTRDMTALDTIHPDAVIPQLRAGNKKQVLQELSRRAAEITGQPEETIFNTLLERERLGSTGIGQGIAIPHGKLPGLDRVYAVFARLERPIDFEAIDEQPVDLVFLLLAPANAGADHLKALAKVSRLLRNGGICKKIRGSSTADAIYALIHASSEKTAA